MRAFLDLRFLCIIVIASLIVVVVRLDNEIRTTFQTHRLIGDLMDHELLKQLKTNEQLLLELRRMQKEERQEQG